MGMNSAIEAVGALTHAYYEDRDTEAVLACVTDDIEWVGTERDDSASGKAELRKLLELDVDAFPDSFELDLEPPVIQPIDDRAAVLTFVGRQVAVPGMICGFTIRGTVVCCKTAEGWLVRSVHASVPNAEMEKYSLKQELTETRRKEQTLLASIPGGVAIYRLKKDNRVETEYVSESLARMCGYTAVAFLNYMKNDAMRNVVPEDAPLLVHTIRESLQKNKPIYALYRIYTKDRQELVIQLNASIIPDAPLAADDVAVAYAVHTNMSEDAQQVVKEQRYYRMVLEMTGIAYFEWHSDGGFYSSEKFANYALSDGGFDAIMGGQQGMGGVHPDDLNRLQNYLVGASGGAHPTPVKVRLKMRDGSYRWTEITGHAERGADGSFNRLAGILRDVDTEWVLQNKRLQVALDEAQAANRAKTDFLSRVSHDMRTPLNGILGLTNLMRSTVADDRIRQDLAQMELSGQYLLNLINDTLDVSRIENGKLELHPTVCDGRRLFNNVIRLVQPSLAEKQIHFVLHADNLPFSTLYMDVGRVEQIFMNVLGNAVKFTPAGGQVEVRVTNLSVADGVIVDSFTVRDNGIGMSAAFLPHLFEPFAQENNATTNAKQGTGLGMTITKQLIELMGGRLSVESERGKGTCVSFTLPLRVATEAQIREAQVAGHQRQDDGVLKGKRVLLCEDHPLNAQIATRLLNAKGVLVEQGANGKDGLQMFEASSTGYYDAILMDIRMPIMDGNETARAIRKLPRSDAKTVPIIAMTANAFESDRREALLAGMNEHLSKPIEPEKLYQTLEKLMKLERTFARKKILVVDDVEANRAVIRASLMKDYDVIEAENGKLALDYLQAHHWVDAVITDIQMPEMDGLELIRRIRSMEPYRRTVIIANTQFGDPEQEESLLALGANDFVYKPTTPRIIEIRVRNALHAL